MRDTSAFLRRARWATAAIFFLNGFIIGSWAAHIPLVKEGLAIGHDELGLALFAMATGALVAMPAAGALISRIGSAAVARVSVPAFVAMFPLVVLAPDAPLLFAALFLFGAANGAMDVSINAHGALVEARLARPAMSSFHGMWSLGGLIAGGLAALLLPIIPPVSHAIFTTGLAALLGGAGCMGLLPAAADKGSGGAGFVLPFRATYALGALCFLSMMTEGAVVEWSALHLRSRLGLSAGSAAVGFAAFFAAMAIGRFFGDRLRSRIAAVHLVRSSAVIAAAGLLVALLAPWGAAAIIGFGVAGLGVSNLVPIFFSAAARISGQASGTAIAAVATMGYGGFLLGPPLIGGVAEATSLTLALGSIVIACLAIALAAAAVAPARKPGG